MCWSNMQDLVWTERMGHNGKINTGVRATVNHTSKLNIENKFVRKIKNQYGCQNISFCACVPQTSEVNLA